MSHSSKAWEFNKGISVDVLQFFKLSVHSYSSLIIFWHWSEDCPYYLPFKDFVFFSCFVYDPCIWTVRYHWTYNCFMQFTLVVVGLDLCVMMYLSQIGANVVLLLPLSSSFYSSLPSAPLYFSSPFCPHPTLQLEFIFCM